MGLKAHAPSVYGAFGLAQGRLLKQCPFKTRIYSEVP